jgi:predicted Holliday junction resolvase-like endonuclease
MSEALLLLFILLGWMGVITIVAVVVRLYRGRPSREAAELEELWARLAREEISREEYDRRRRELTPKT